MSIPKRLFNAAVNKLREGIDPDSPDWFMDLTRGRGRGSDERAELDDFLAGQPQAAPPPPPHPLHAEYRALGLEPGAGAEEIRAAWRQAARENHPDRFSGDPAAQAAARERFLIKQQAFEAIIEDLGGR